MQEITKYLWNYLKIERNKEFEKSHLVASGSLDCPIFCVMDVG